ncbi:MAG TPA: tetratricopeptide repeat protein [Anaerolineales bacterium]|nr:tetratricopeptide repeat protein [Anaerolineales bacterium]
MFEFLVNLIKSSFGNVESQVFLGSHYINKSNPSSAMKWLKRAAEKGEPRAYTGLGYCNDLDGNIEEALRYYQLAIASGEAEAPYLLGLLYFIGEDVPKDSNKAFECYSLSAKRGFPNAIHMLAWCYEQGVGTDEDIEMATRLYKQAASLGVPEAKEALQLNGTTVE